MGINETTTGLDFERAAVAHFGLTAFRVHRGMAVTTDTHGTASLTLNIALAADDLASIAAHMKDGNEIGKANKLREFLGKSVQSQMPAPAQAEPASVAGFQVGDKVMLRSGGPAMDVVAVNANGDIVCSWRNAPASTYSSSAFPPECLTRVSATQDNPVSS